jgi:transposase-like protein
MKPARTMTSGDGQQQNLEKFGKTRKGVQRYRCQTCRKTFTETFGTLFYGKRTPEHEILETLALLAEDNRISALSRVKGHKEDTIYSPSPPPSQNC